MCDSELLLFFGYSSLIFKENWDTFWVFTFYINILFALSLANIDFFKTFSFLRLLLTFLFFPFFQDCETQLDASFLSIAANNYVEALAYLENANAICPGKK